MNINLVLLMPVLMYSIPHLLGITTPKQGMETISDVLSIGFIGGLAISLWITALRKAQEK